VKDEFGFGKACERLFFPLSLSLFKMKMSIERDSGDSLLCSRGAVQKFKLARASLSLLLRKVGEKLAMTLLHETKYTQRQRWRHEVCHYQRYNAISRRKEDEIRIMDEKEDGNMNSELRFLFFMEMKLRRYLTQNKNTLLSFHFRLFL